MNLYDIMNKKPKQEMVAPVVEEEASASLVQLPIAPEQAEPQAVQSTPETAQKPYTWWWQTPDFVGAVESQAKAAEKRAEQDRKRARRERNIAILGDLAKLGAQMYAKAGGATRIDQFAPAAEKANDKLAALRERHAAEVAAFARQRAAAQQAQIADNNARMKLESQMAEAKRLEAKQDEIRKQEMAYRKEKDAQSQREFELRKKNSELNEARMKKADEAETRKYNINGEEYTGLAAAYAALPEKYKKKERDLITGKATNFIDYNVSEAEMRNRVEQYLHDINKNNKKANPMN